MKKKLLRTLRMLGVTIVLVLLWLLGIVNVPRLIVQGGEYIQQWGTLPLVTIIVIAYAVKGRFTLFPSFGVVTASCAFLPLWAGLPLAIAGHMLGQTICWYWGPASHCKGGTGVLPQDRIRNVWQMMAMYFLIPQTDIALLELRTKPHLRDRDVLLCGLPFIILADTFIVLSGNGILQYLKTFVT